MKGDPVGFPQELVLTFIFQFHFTYFLVLWKKDMNILRIKFMDDARCFNTNQDRVIRWRKSREDGNGQSLWPDSATQICEEGFYVQADNNGRPLKVQPKAAYIWSVKGWSREITAKSAGRQLLIITFLPKMPDINAHFLVSINFNVCGFLRLCGFMLQSSM